MTVPTDLDRRFRDTAVRSGLLDASYDVIESELGPLLAAVTDHGLARISTTRIPSASSRRLPGWQARVSCVLRERWTRHAASSTTTSRASAPRSTSSSTCAA